MTQTILVTGGCGYIGSHTVVELLQANHKVVILDNLCNSSEKVIERIKAIAQIKAQTHAGGNTLANDDALTFIKGDIRNETLLTQVFNTHPINSVIHFAGLKAVGESVAQPLDYYHNNIHGTLCLCSAMHQAKVKTLVFSSSATVYGEDASVPYKEAMPMGNTTNPYGTSKAMVEKILTDQCTADPQWSVAKLRYFNPIGAHKSGLIGEDPKGIPNNLLPYISQVALGKRKELSVFGGDYPTPDGTGIRDYIHVVDLAKGHLKALTKIQQEGNKVSENGEHIWNLGAGKGYSVLQVIKAFEQASGKNIPYQIKPRRNGDLTAFWADASKAKRDLNWVAEKTLHNMVSDSWNWQSNNPNGYI
ncbi:UDP-glucose 4-epimerase GalE [Porticoccaceae bacterium]|nr:UDP-glucose 4-epimerase GalE [Porticoccaceae bacterium]